MAYCGILYDVAIKGSNLKDSWTIVEQVDDRNYGEVGQKHVRTVHALHVKAYLNNIHFYIKKSWTITFHKIYLLRQEFYYFYIHSINYTVVAL